MEQVVSALLLSRGSFGALLRAGHHRANLPQEQLAARAGLSERGVRNLEAGRVRSPRPDTVRLLADALLLSGPERDSWVAAARGVRGRLAGPVAGGAARATPGLVVRLIAVVARGRLGPEPSGGSLGGQGEQCGHDDLPACWAKVIRVLIMGKEHDIDWSDLTDGKCWVFDLGERASRRTFEFSGDGGGEGHSASAIASPPAPIASMSSDPATEVWESAPSSDPRRPCRDCRTSAGLSAWQVARCSAMLVEYGRAGADQHVQQGNRAEIGPRTCAHDTAGEVDEVPGAARDDAATRALPARGAWPPSGQRLVPVG